MKKIKSYIVPSIPILLFLWAAGCGSGIGDFARVDQVKKLVNGALLQSSTGSPGSTGSTGERTAPPVFSSESGIYAHAFTLSMTSQTPGAVITYTTDGSDPAASPTAATGTSCIIHGDTTVKAFASSSSPVNSETVTALYKFPDRTVTGTIQAAIDAASAGEVIYIPAGSTYTESFTINKYVRLIGDGNGDDPAINTIIQHDDNAIVTISASGNSAAAPIILKNLRIEPKFKEAIVIGSYLAPFDITVSYLTLKNVTIHGISVNNDSTSKTREAGIEVNPEASLHYCTILDSEFSDLSYGITIYKDMTAADSTDTVTHLSVSRTDFIFNSVKGIYAEKLSDSDFTDIFVYNNGQLYTNWMPSWMYPYNAGIDINLKGMAYQNLTFSNIFLQNNGKGSKEGCGLCIKARGSGTDSASYMADPASLSGVTINGGTFTGNERGIRIGEPGKSLAEPADVSILNANIYGNAHTYSGGDGSEYGGLINQMQPAISISAIYNWWDDTTGPTHSSNPGGNGEVIYGEASYSPWGSSLY